MRNKDDKDVCRSVCPCVCLKLPACLALSLPARVVPARVNVRACVRALRKINTTREQ